MFANFNTQRDNIHFFGFEKLFVSQTEFFAIEIIEMFNEKL